MADARNSELVNRSALYVKVPEPLGETVIKQEEEKMDPIASKLFDEYDRVITVNSQQGSTASSFRELIDANSKLNKITLIVTTPGPFKDNKELPEGWKATGCTAELNALNALGAEFQVYAINHHDAAYQAGAAGLLSVKKWANIQMISDENGELRKALDIKSIGEAQPYAGRVVIAIAPNKKTAVFRLPDACGPGHLNDLLEQLNAFNRPVAVAAPAAPSACCL